MTPSERGASTDKARGARETVEGLVHDCRIRWIAAYKEGLEGGVYDWGAHTAEAALLAHFAQVLADVQHENRLRRAAESECLDAHVALRAAEAERDAAYEKCACVCESRTYKGWAADRSDIDVDTINSELDACAEAIRALAALRSAIASAGKENV